MFKSKILFVSKQRKVAGNEKTQQNNTYTNLGKQDYFLQQWFLALLSRLSRDYQGIIKRNKIFVSDCYYLAWMTLNNTKQMYKI